MDDDPILMSLADALTCAFGASIAMFLIFVVLVRFEPPSPVPTSGAIASESLTNSLAADTPGASSLVIIARSRIPDATDCADSVVASLKIGGTDPSSVRTWAAAEPVRSGARFEEVVCTRVFEVPAGVAAGSRPSVLATRGGHEVVEVRVHVGANAWPSWDRPNPFQVPPGSGTGEVELLTVTGQRDRPVRIPGDD